MNDKVGGTLWIITMLQGLGAWITENSTLISVCMMFVFGVIGVIFQYLGYREKVKQREDKNK